MSEKSDTIPPIFDAETVEKIRAAWSEAGAAMLAAAEEAIRPLREYCTAVVRNFTNTAPPPE